MIQVENQLIGVSLLLISGYLGGQVAKRIKLPAVAGYCLAGFLLSPSLFNLMPEALNMELEALKVLGLSMIAMIIGGELHLKTIKRIGKSILTISVIEILVTMLVVFLGMYFLLGADLSISLIMATMATATAPGATVAVIKEYKARGNFTSTLLGVIAVDDALCIMLVGFSIAAARGIMDMGTTFEIQDMLHPSLELFGSLVVGTMTGVIMCFLLKYIKERMETIVVLLSFVLLNSGISIYFDLSPLLVNMTCGAVTANLFVRDPLVLNYLDDIDLPVFIIFFTLAGASLHLEVLFANWFPALAYITTRAMGKMGGCYLGAVASKADPSVKKYLGWAMLPKAGVSIGLILFVQSRFPGTGLAAVVTAMELAAVTFYEITGPIATRYALIGSGDARVEKGQAAPGLKV